MTKTLGPEERQELMKKMFDDAFRIEVEVLEDGKLPAKANQTDAGFDVYATSDIRLYPGQVLKHPLNIKMKLPAGAWARIETKSGLGSKGHHVWAGVIDEGYRGIPHVIMSNIKMVSESGITNTYPIEIKKGEKLAQITMNPHNNEFYMVQVDSVSADTSRGAGGFGSTGK